MSGKVITRVSELPQTDHFAILANSTYYVPGDERSRTNPGHGYPAENVPYLQYIAFENKEQLAEWIRIYGSTKSYKVIASRMVKIETRIQVKMGG